MSADDRVNLDLVLSQLSFLYKNLSLVLTLLITLSTIRSHFRNLSIVTSRYFTLSVDFITKPWQWMTKSSTAFNFLEGPNIMHSVLPKWRDSLLSTSQSCTLYCTYYSDHRHQTYMYHVIFSLIFIWQLKTRAPRGTDRSPEYNEHFCYKLDSRVKNLTTEWYQKQQHFITHASRSLLWIRFVAVAFRSEEEVFWRKDPTPPPPVTYFASPWICPWANMAKTSLCMCPGHEHFIPTKFRKHPLSGSGKGWLCVPIHIHA